ncbi:MAG: RrF2 family transcriptional regulator [Planctomycetota bacterium]|jgi:Rrf2 family protein
MKLSRGVSYALQAALQLAEMQREMPVPCSQLASEGKMPERFLLQILRNLVAHGILDSVRGVDGGYTLERSPTDVSLLEVIEAIEGPLVVTLPTSEGLPSESKARLRDALSQLTTEARRRLEAVTLASLLPRPPRRKGTTTAKSSRRAASTRAERTKSRRRR